MAPSALVCAYFTGAESVDSKFVQMNQILSALRTLREAVRYTTTVNIQQRANF